MGWLLLLLLTAAVAQSAVLPGLVMNAIRPDLAVVIVVGWATLRGWEEGVLVGLAAGFFVDLASAAPFGVHVIRLGLLGLVAGFAMTRLARTSAVLPIAAAVVGSLGAFLFAVLSLQAAGWTVLWERALILEAAPSALLTGACMAAGFPALRALQRRIAPEGEESGA